jgi:hypothetical protein
MSHRKPRGGTLNAAQEADNEMVDFVRARVEQVIAQVVQHNLFTKRRPVFGLFRVFAQKYRGFFLTESVIEFPARHSRSLTSSPLSSRLQATWLPRDVGAPQHLRRRHYARHRRAHRQD